MVLIPLPSVFWSTSILHGKAGDHLLKNQCFGPIVEMTLHTSKKTSIWLIAYKTLQPSTFLLWEKKIHKDAHLEKATGP